MSDGTGDCFVMAEQLQPYVFSSLIQGGNQKSVVLIITPTQNDAEHLVHNMSVFAGSEVILHFPAWETLPFERISPTAEVMGERLRVISAIGQREKADAQIRPETSLGTRHISEDTTKRPIVVVASVRALLQRICPGIENLTPITISKNSKLHLEALLRDLVQFGYRREYQVEHKGEFAVRGGIVDIFPPIAAEPVRIELFGDEVDRISAFDVFDQRSTSDLDQVHVYSAREVMLWPSLREKAAELALSADFAEQQFARIAEGEFFDGIESFLPWLDENQLLLPDLLNENDRVILVEPRRMRDRANDILAEEESIASGLALTWGIQDVSNLPRLHLHFDRLLAKTKAKTLSILPVTDREGRDVLEHSSWPTAMGDMTAIIDKLRLLCKSNFTIVMYADLPSSARRFADMFEEAYLEVNDLIGDNEAAGGNLKQGAVNVLLGQLDKGFILNDYKLAVLCETDITRRTRPHRVPRQRKKVTEGFFDDLKVGGFVVHDVHGVARFAGMVKRTIGSSERDYLLLEYKGDDKLYIPSDQIDSLTPYTGGDSPTLSRLGNGEFQRQKARARQKVREIAQELLVLYQRRLHTKGFQFSPDTPWQSEMEQSFPYIETRDQLRAIEEVKEDMEKESPMDRLVCGDVGFGKTEVAIRAAFKAIQDGRQVAVLAPTTLLAQQHYQTFRERFMPYPIKVGMLSRFLTQSEQKKVVRSLSEGELDLVIGTHTLLSGNIAWKRLGLLIVDEEQRFGVSHKEAIKAMSIGVDVLTLTASPIPRTLEMGLTGIRDLSVIDTPPAMRQPILTYVGEYEERAVSEAVRRELLREGQVFYVHNRVTDIEHIAHKLASLIPEARIAVAHGQMDEGQLEKVILDFADRKYDVLVCTTIVESGIDMGNVNTLIIDRADLLGLGQLHQLRGRVGRSGQRAYAYLFHPVDRVLSEEAYERLKTIGEFSELGAGFKIAMRDLQIRGAGNLLGHDQSGHIASVGYDLYVRMVAEAIQELKGEEVPVPTEIKVELPVKANIPAGYIEKEDLRLEAYRMLAGVKTKEELQDLAGQWRDRFGPLPESVQELLVAAELRLICLGLGIKETSVIPSKSPVLVGSKKETATARLSPVKLAVSAQVRLQRLYPKAIYKSDTGQLILPLERRGKASFAQELIVVLQQVFPPS
jgi:transcription-repair coupling factor (superfamily II helicase)